MGKENCFQAVIFNMKDGNFEYTDFSPDVFNVIKNVEFSKPKLIVDENDEIAAVVVNPDQYASMCDQVADMKLMVLAIKRLTGESDPAKLSLEDFLNTCKLDDQFLDSECADDDESTEPDALYEDCVKDVEN